MIGPETLERLRAVSPYNVVHLILPARQPGSTAPGSRGAAALLDAGDAPGLASRP